MSKIVTYNNVLNPLDRTILTSGNYKNIDEILRELKYDNTIYDLVISKNSVIMHGFFEVSEGDIVNIAIVPKGGGGGKQILGAVAMVALAVTAVGVGSLWAGSSWATGFTVTSAAGVTSLTTTGMMIQAGIMGGVMLAGGLLLNAIMPKPSTSLKEQDFKNSQTYGWNTATNQAMQSQAIPKIYGTHKLTPPLIASYVEAIDDKQYFNGLYALNDGVVKSVKDIKINNEPIGNFKGVSYEVRTGTTTQTLIQSFNDTHYDKAVNKKLSTDLSYAVAETDGNAVTSLNVTLLMSRGLWHANDKGGLDNCSITVAVEYSSDGATWTKFPKSPITITNNQTSAFRNTLKVTGLAPDRYSVRAKFATAPKTGSRYGSDCYLEYVTETISDDFIYPSTALLAVRALATDQLSGNMPIITAVVSANSDNPAEVCRQILKDSGVQSSRIMPSFNEWATWCKQKGFKCNIVFDSEVSVRKALDTVSLLGRASVLQAGSKFDVIMEKAELIPVQSFMFGMGNILSGTFKQTFLPLVDRANFLEITYYDKDKEYEPTVISVSNSPLENNQVLNKTSVTLVGCTDESQARAYGRFALNCNRYLTQTIGFEAHMDSLVCRYGDIVKVSHDLPQYGFSGRLAEDSEGDILTLDRDMEFMEGVYYAVQIKNDINEIREYQVIDLISPNQIRVDLKGRTYKKYDLYAVGEINRVTKLYRIIKIATSGNELTRHITAIEYIEDVYSDSETIHHENISALGLGNLRVNESLRLDASKNILTYLNLAWRGSALNYTVTLKNLTTNKAQSLRVNDSFCEVRVSDGISYEITVSDNFGSSVATTHKVIGKLAPPPEVESLTASELRDEWSMSWAYDDKPIDFKHFEIYKNSKLVGRTTEQSFTIKKELGNMAVSVVAVDTSSIKSEEASITLTNTAPNAVTSLQRTELRDEWSLGWEYNPPVDFSHFEIYKGGKLFAKTADVSYILKKDTQNIGLTVYAVDTLGLKSAPVSINLTNTAPNAITNLNYVEARSEWEVSWSYSPPVDFSHFEVYKNGTLLATTPATNIRVSKDGSVCNISVYAVDSVGLKSTEVAKSLTTKAPANVTGFGTIYKNNKLHAFWSEAGKNLSYEIRKGANWDNGYKIADTTELIAPLNFNGMYLIKAYYENDHGLRVYSAGTANIVIDESRLDINVMETIAQPTWSGTHSNTQIANNGLCLKGDYTNATINSRKLTALSGTYTISKVITLTKEKICNINAFMDISGLALRDNFDTIPNVDLVANIDGTNENDYTAKLQIATSKDGTTYTVYKDFVSGEYIAKAFKFRVVLTAKTELVTPLIHALNIMVDMPDVVESESSTSAASGAISILYKNDFSITPKVQITIVDAQAGDDAILTNQTGKGFTIRVINKNGANVSRNFNYIAKGY